MGITNLSALEVAGVPTMGTGGLLPFTGRYIFCDYANGSDGYEGTADRPYKTLAFAYSQATDGSNDVIFIVSAPISGASTTGTQRLEETLTWSKSAVHLIGLTAPSMLGQRARIAPLTTATTNINPLITVSGQGCMFLNFSMFQGIGQASTDEQLIDVTGQRNYFGNVDFGGMGHANGAARAGSYVIYLNGGSENVFEGCTIGVDTIARTAANASVKLRTAATRNIFKNCLFPMYATAATPLFVDANASASIDRFTYFKGCTFANAINSGTGTAVTAVVSFHASQGGTIIVDSTTGGAIGATDWTATDTATVKILGPVPNGDTTGMAVSSDAT